MQRIVSQLKSHNLDPTIIVTPQHEFNLRHRDSLIASQLNFETKRDAVAEDKTRARLLMNSDDPEAHILAEEILLAIDEGDVLLNSASAVYASELRIKLIGNVLELVDEEFGHSEVKSFTAVFDGWKVKACDLGSASGKKFKKKIRKIAEWSELLANKGIVVAFLHVEYRDGYFWFHLHGIVAGAKIGALPKLRQHRQLAATLEILRPLRCGNFNEEDFVCKLAGWLAYSSRFYCSYHKPFTNDDGDVSMQNHESRLPEPVHTQFLMWQAKQNASDFMFLNGLKLRGDGTAMRFVRV